MLWFSDSLMRWAEQMEVVVLAWFVLIETNSAFLLGIFASLRFTGTLFAPLYGIAVDRYDRRTILIFSRAGFGIVALLTLLLTLTDSLARTPRDSAHWYRDVIARNGLVAARPAAR